MTLDLSTTSDVYDSAFENDGSLNADVEDELARAAVQDGARLVVTQYGQPRLSRTRKLSQESPDVVATGISIWPASPTRARRAVGRRGRRDRRPDAAGRRIRADAFGCASRSASGSVSAGEPLADAPRGRMGGSRCATGRCTRGADC